jgi:hypothetical protein
MLYAVIYIKFKFNFPLSSKKNDIYLKNNLYSYIYINGPKKLIRTIKTL